MVAGLLAMVVTILVVVALPVALYTAIRALRGVASSDPGVIASNQAVEARLRRIEDAIDAMSQQIERMRTGDRYVPGERSERRQLPPPDDPPTFR